MSVFGVILVRIFPHSDWIQTRTPNTDTFYKVINFNSLRRNLYSLEYLAWVSKSSILGLWPVWEIWSNMALYFSVSTLFPVERVIPRCSQTLILEICTVLINIIEVLHFGVASIPKLPREMSFQRFFFRPTHPGKKRRTAADTCR